MGQKPPFLSGEKFGFENINVDAIVGTGVLDGPYKNEIFAKYDGNYVTEYAPHERATYYTVPRFGAGTDPIPAIKVDKRGVEFTSSIGAADGDSNSNSETKTEDAVASSDFEPKGVEETLAGVFDTDYFSGMTDIDAFLKSNLES